MSGTSDPHASRLIFRSTSVLIDYLRLLAASRKLGCCVQIRLIWGQGFEAIVVYAG